MPKAPKKHSISRRRRPKSIYAKGWETRRLRKIARDAYLEEATGALSNALGAVTSDPKAAQAAGWTPVNVAEAAMMTSDPNVRSEISGGDALLRLTTLHRDEQLSCFMADMAAMRRMGMPSHAPVIITRSQIEAIEDFLAEHGVSMFGRNRQGQAPVGETNKAA